MEYLWINCVIRIEKYNKVTHDKKKKKKKN